jgi:hypothetical protein
MIYTIQKGSHRSTWLPKFTTNTIVNFNFQFLSDPSYIVDNQADQEDTNKIFGVSDSWNHHKHSIRLGWRYDDKMQQSILSVYYYRDGKHYIQDLGQIEQEKLYYCYISIYKDNYLVGGLGDVVSIPRTSKWWGPRYLLFPYFGGQQVAPKQFKIELTNW